MSRRRDDLDPDTLYVLRDNLAKADAFITPLADRLDIHERRPGNTSVRTIIGPVSESLVATITALDPFGEIHDRVRGGSGVQS
jgi:hypothetical protein